MVDTGGSVTLLSRISATTRECSFRLQDGWVMYADGLELFGQDPLTGAIRLYSSGARGSHWPTWNPAGTLVSYSRVLRRAFEPDSVAGLRVLDPETGADRAVMRTSTRAWKARGPATWSPAGDRLAFFDADSVVNGQTRLVVVDLAGGSATTIGWAEGVPGSITWPTPDDWLFDTTPGECPSDASARRTWHIPPSGATTMVAIELGDPRVFSGYPFAISPDGKWSAHVGLSDSVGVIVVTSTQSGQTRVLTTP